MPELADAQTVRRWALSSGRNMSVATLRMFRADTGCGMTREALIEIMSGTRMKPSLDDLETLTTNVPTDASLRAEVLVHLMGALTRCVTPGSLGQFVREFNRYPSLVDVDRLTATWTAAIERIAALGESALSIADGTPAADVDAADLTFDQALASRDRAVIARWGADAQESARFSRLDLFQARGLEDVVEDALVRAGSLV